MSAASVPLKGGGHGWQVILADLALILFLLTLSALPAAEAETGRKPTDRAARAEETRARTATAAIAAAQALYRPVTDGPTLAEWLAAQPHDPRATLTVFARYRPGGEAAAWDAARALAAGASGGAVPVRTIITAGAETDLYASLAYDEVPAAYAQ
ncbi:hypothetical protein [Erythrobacter sanguineus]|uniref:Uncharacterized protein n=1 Tax=Erythrobacter sanguineus TaxID=198312 RepID=A0A1M7SEY3_9SPHN|nr:hypothetical protein [Erythrobacter sanguineus]SHN57037.1 hypothetical protein SAMN02745193_01562 [Erythrobacter sanguineus]